MTARVSGSEFSFPAIPGQAVVWALGFELVDIALFAGDDEPLVADPGSVAAALQITLQTQRLSPPNLLYATGNTFEEICGPALSVMEFRDEDEAVELSNAVPFGMAGTVWTRDVDRAMRFAEQIDTGIIWTNCPHPPSWNVPYEGFKLSGRRDDIGSKSLNTFTQLKVHYLNFDGERIGWPSH